MPVEEYHHLYYLYQKHIALKVCRDDRQPDNNPVMKENKSANEYSKTSHFRTLYLPYIFTAPDKVLFFSSGKY